MRILHDGLIKTLSIILFLYVVFLSCSNESKRKANSEKQDQITVYAAASLTNVLSEIIDSFRQEHNVEVKLNIGSSGTLARQIVQGGEPDIYISANKQWIDYIDSSGYIANSLKLVVARNELVLIAPLNSSIKVPAIDNSLDISSLIGSDRISIGNPEHVPAGIYAKQSLEYYKLFRSVENKILPAKDVRSALMVVEMKEVPLGIVYRTDAQKSNKVKILNTFPEVSHDSIMYFAGICNNNKVAKEFFTYLNSDSTKTIWMKYGFKK